MGYIPLSYEPEQDLEVEVPLALRNAILADLAYQRFLNDYCHILWHKYGDLFFGWGSLN